MDCTSSTHAAMTTTGKILFRIQDPSPQVHNSSDNATACHKGASIPLHPVLAMFVKINEPYPKRILPPADNLKRVMTLGLSTMFAREGNRWAFSILDNSDGALNNIHLLPPLHAGESISLGLDLIALKYRVEVLRAASVKRKEGSGCNWTTGYSQLQVWK